MAKTTVRLLILIVGFTVWPLAAAALEPLAVYEDWSVSLMRPDRWDGAQGFGGGEIKRQITAGQRLLMRYRREGSAASNSGTTNSFHFIRPANHAQVNEIEATFTVTNLSMTACAANNAGGLTRARPARLHMEKFNDGTSSGPGDRTGDHEGIVQVFRDGNSASPPGVMSVHGVIIRCSNPTCTTTTTVVSNTLATTVTVGQTFTLALKWDQPNHQFLFSLDSSGDIALPYAASDTAAPGLSLVEIMVLHNTASCLAGAVSIDSTTELGTVRTNTSAVIP
jgi:hypothetical protein